MTLGKTSVTWEGSATTAEGANINGNGSLIYSCLPKVYVDQLGLPTNVSMNADGSFSSSDSNVFTRDFNWNSTSGVTGTSFGSWERTIIVKQLNDSTELAEAQFNEEWAIRTTLLPKDIEAIKSGKELVRVQYLRVVKPEAPKPIEISYRKTLTLDLEDTKGGIYADMLVEQIQGESVLNKWGCYGIMATWGEYKPQVSAQSVSSFEFTTHDKAGENKELEADVPGLGDKGTFTRKNVRHTAETFEVQFPSADDAEGNTVRPIRGQIDVWVYTYTFENPEDNHTEDFSVEVEVVSTKSEVNNSTYERTIEIRINGEVVDVQNGKVSLTIG
jgi:hypothetical protein